MQSNTNSDVTENQVVLNNAAPDKESNQQSAKAPESSSESKSDTQSANQSQSASDSGNCSDTSQSDDAAGADKGAESKGATSGNREPLRRRVESRIAEIEAAAAQLTDGNNTERANALSTALQLARDVTGTGWEHVGEMEAMRLSQWLDTTEPLVSTGSQETGVMLGGAKPATGAMTQATAPLNATTTPDADTVPKARPVTADYPR